MSFVFATLQAVDAALSTSGGGTVDLGTAAGGAAVARVSLSGTNPTSSFGSGAEKNRMVRYLSATPLVNGPALALIGNANRTTSPGSVGFYASDAAGNWTELAYAGGDTALIGQGTAMLFLQPTAPVGWTKSTAHNDKALRIVSGASGGGVGGSLAFSSVFGPGKATDGTGLAVGHLPGLSGGTTDLTVSHLPTGLKFLSTSATIAVGGTSGTDYPDPVIETSGALTSGGGADLFTGTGAAHAHTVPLDLKYVDAIICTKD